FAARAHGLSLRGPLFLARTWIGLPVGDTVFAPVAWNAFRSLRGNCPETIADASFQHSLAGLGEDVPARHSGTPNPQVALVGAPWHGVHHPPRKIEKWLAA